MIYQGSNSKIKIKGSFVYKELAEKIAGLNFYEAEKLIEHLRYYDQTLTRLGILHPKIFKIETINISNGRYGVTIKEERVKGETVDKLLLNSKISDKICLGLCKTVLDYHMRVRADGRKISLDPPLANFIVSGNGKKIYYVDLMPPRQQTKNKLILECPGPKDRGSQKYNFIRHFTDFQFQVIFIQMCRNRIQLRRKFEKLIAEGINKNSLKYFAVPKDINQMFNLLSSGEIINVDYLRNLALELWFQRKISKKDFHKIYLKTHIAEGTGEIPNKQTLKNVRNFLIGSILK